MADYMTGTIPTPHNIVCTCVVETEYGQKGLASAMVDAREIAKGLDINPVCL